MDTSKFFETQNDLSFENYFRTTHENFPKDSLASARSILHDYIKDVKYQQRQQNHATARLKTSYNDEDLKRLIQENSKRSNDNDHSTVYNNYISNNTIEQLKVEQNRITQDKVSCGQKRSREKPSTSKPEQPFTSTQGKRDCRRIIAEDFISSELVTDDDSNSDITTSQSSFYPSDLMNTPVGYNCRIDMHELEDVPSTPLPIRNPNFAALIASAKKKCDEDKLFPTDCLSRLHASAIFKADGPFSLSDDDDNDTDVLPENVYNNIRAFKRAMQKRILYIQPNTSATLEQIALNNIITSTYLLHGRPRIKSKGSELNLVASSVSTFLSPLFSAHDQIQLEFDTTSWIFKQDGVENVSLRPDIIFNYQQLKEVVEIGCGEVKKPGVSQALLDEDKMRVLEVMKRQLHLRLCRARKEYEAVSFGVLIQGTKIILLKMKLDIDKGLYMYYEQQPFILPTTNDTYAHMEIALEVITKFKTHRNKC
ncbi:uncharacterized protein B0P05DRAFT_570386 [Gilbertella persicaria]|uniref:uncharacterized protein n=1 Tax=Gilbertella persicaria TaxID=101096 RepID=UPI00221EE118|nr:uncharacterized protein B0P05DRAFT_570386 [Gilbertella persicaria]KAI8083968.1 hypothetical protein B0P05DRAFT_570386 [Gilbertella persicaria]